MKKLLLALLVTSSLSASATIIGDSRTNPCDGYNADGVTCTLGITFSLPTIIVSDKEIQLSEEQTMLTIMSEMDEASQPITAAFAEANKMTIEEVQDLAVASFNK